VHGAVSPAAGVLKLQHSQEQNKCYENPGTKSEMDQNRSKRAHLSQSYMVGNSM